MGNCLVTKLQGVVNDYSLPVFNKLRLKFKKSNTINKIYAGIGGSGTPFTMNILTGGHFCDENGNNPTESVTVGGGDNIFVDSSAADVIVVFPNDCSLWSIAATIGEIEIMDGDWSHLPNFKFFNFTSGTGLIYFNKDVAVKLPNNMTELKLGGSTRYDGNNIDTEDIGQITTLTKLTIIYSNDFHGDIVHLANLVNLDTSRHDLYQNSALLGSMSALFDAWLAGGQMEGKTIKLNFNGCPNITLGTGVTALYGQVTFTSSSWSFTAL